MEKTSSAETPAQDGEQPAPGGQVLRDALQGYPDLEQEVKENGTPDAIEDNFPRISFYYRHPPRTLVYQLTPITFSVHRVIDIPVVPRSIRLLAFKERQVLEPWPVTISPEQAEILGMPALPPSPRAMDAATFASKYREKSEGVRQKVVEVKQGESYDRAAKALARLNPSARLPGFGWRIVVAQSPCNLVLGIPDGTIFLSDGLITSLSDDELAAVIAHLLGHEAYGHDRDMWTEYSTAQKTAFVVAATVVVAAALAVGYGGQGSNQAPPYVGYSPEQEGEANSMAVQYLAAANIPPDSLIDAMVKLASPTCPTQVATPPIRQMVDFAMNHHAQRSAADLGKMLDAGILSPHTATSVGLSTESSMAASSRSEQEEEVK